IAWQGSASLIIAVLGFIQLLVLAKYLNSYQFGILAIVFVIINITQVIADLGMANFIVYKQTEDNLVHSTVFWLSTFIGSMLSIIC
uniref:oligosaccharide flippase family protein n=1 Tax=Vibrio campbellii TaxID=680 RepID=UPI000A85CD40